MNDPSIDRFFESEVRRQDEERLKRTLADIDKTKDEDRTIAITTGIAVVMAILGLFGWGLGPFAALWLVFVCGACTGVAMGAQGQRKNW